MRRAVIACIPQTFAILAAELTGESRLGGHNDDQRSVGVADRIVVKITALRARVAGVVTLEDILKSGMQERFERLRNIGLRTAMIHRR